jgi:hypothetical protein
VDANRVTASLSAWLGGFLSQPDPGTVVATFLGPGGTQLGNVGIGPVTPDERNRDLKFVQKSHVQARRTLARRPQGAVHGVVRPARQVGSGHRHGPGQRRREACFDSGPARDALPVDRA